MDAEQFHLLRRFGGLARLREEPYQPGKVLEGAVARPGVGHRIKDPEVEADPAKKSKKETKKKRMK